MPDTCPHAKRYWFSDIDGTAVLKRHKPTSGKNIYSEQATSAICWGFKPANATASRMQPLSPSPFVSATLAAYLDLLNRYLVTKLSDFVIAAGVNGGKAQDLWCLNNPPKGGAGRTPLRVVIGELVMPTPISHPETIARFSFSEAISWQNPFRGVSVPTDKEKADALAIGGMRNTAESYGKLHYLVEFGLKFGRIIREMFQRNVDKHRSDDVLDEIDAWANRICECIGSVDLRPPADAIGNVRPKATHQARSPAEFARETNDVEYRRRPA